MISELADLEYSERLRKCNLATLEIRRHREDLLEVYRIVHGIDDLDPGDFFIFRSDGMGRDSRCHNLHIQKQRFSLFVRKFCFLQRVVDHWSALPADAVNVPTINAFNNYVNPILKQG